MRHDGTHGGKNQTAAGTGGTCRDDGKVYPRERPHCSEPGGVSAQLRRTGSAIRCRQGSVRRGVGDYLCILYPRMWTHRKKGWGKTLAKHCSDENGFRQCESFFMDRSRCRKLPLRLTEKPISMDSFKNVEFLEHGQSKKVWNPCNKTLVQGSESFRMDKVATVDER